MSQSAASSGQYLPGMEIDRLEDADVARDSERILADEQVLEGFEAVHRVAGPDADDAGVGLDADDRGREPSPGNRVPGGRKGRVERRIRRSRRIGTDTHRASIARGRGRRSLTVGQAASTVRSQHRGRAEGELDWLCRGQRQML